MVLRFLVLWIGIGLGFLVGQVVPPCASVHAAWEELRAKWPALQSLAPQESVGPEDFLQLAGQRVAELEALRAELQKSPASALQTEALADVDLQLAGLQELSKRLRAANQDAVLRRRLAPPPWIQRAEVVLGAKAEPAK